MVPEGRRPSSRAAGGGMRGGARGGGKLQAQGRAAPGQGYFTPGLAALFLCLTALLVLLPLVLPPLPPPPLPLLLVPVGLMAVLLALALVPSSDGRRASAAVASSCLY
ncbi:protein AUXIN-REGULATED PROTEIN INVOLVED IN ORGAN SIZE-like [Panicum miliaceum]|uniref:Protein AUXIN-REGULATED PROTEIN INVOLVED IN ORGAN SIZE-like n=1 Tax=Panicum miliaceum TaxID=4540 RepID=A0A3L6RB36_PANMI|nr:protein AUXIN-REGULATED PROTEIN INVOLVED IN ORGAN SIZE-like [Panicum miliaceum]